MSETAGGEGVVAQAGDVGEAPAEGAQNAAAARQPTKMESAMAIIKSLIIRALIIYFVTSFFRKPQPTQTPSNSNNPNAGLAAKNIFADGTALSMYLYVTETENNLFEDSKMIWAKDVTYGDWTSGPNRDGTYEKNINIPVTKHLLNNGSLYLHAYILNSGEHPAEKQKQHSSSRQMCYTRKQLNRFKMLKSSGTKNLLSGTSEVDFGLEDGKIISHWHPNMTLNLVTDQTQWSWGNVPAPLNEYIEFMDDGKHYKPILYANDFWNMAKDYKPLNESLTLRITFQPLSLFKWQLYAAQSMRQKYFNFFGEADNEPKDEEQDTLKETLLDTNPYLLALTIVVSIVHSVFELLAFKNDIQFWNNRNSLEGLSVKSVFFGVFQSVIVLLYVLDNDTNTVVRISCFVGLCIELWKIRKVIDINFINGRLSFAEKNSYVESNTKDYDNIAFKYLSWVCFPLLAGYSVYALLYLEHKGWYSFILNLLYGYLLTFGFIMMTPQLFINYKLKSVAHLPWRMLTYKFLNTFIDDMFAFVIKMPTMYRIGCFRDDIIFLIYLYQRWIYPVDKTRTNEFGYTEAEQQQAVEGAPQQEQAKAKEIKENGEEQEKESKKTK